MKKGYAVKGDVLSGEFEDTDKCEHRIRLVKYFMG